MFTSERASERIGIREKNIRLTRALVAARSLQPESFWNKLIVTDDGVDDPNAIHKRNHWENYPQRMIVLISSRTKAWSRNAGHRFLISHFLSTGLPFFNAVKSDQ